VCTTGIYVGDGFENDMAEEIMEWLLLLEEEGIGKAYLQFFQKLPRKVAHIIRYFFLFQILLLPSVITYNCVTG